MKTQTNPDKRMIDYKLVKKIMKVVSRGLSECKLPDNVFNELYTEVFGDPNRVYTIDKAAKLLDKELERYNGNGLINRIRRFIGEIFDKYYTNKLNLLNKTLDIVSKVNQLISRECKRLENLDPETFKAILKSLRNELVIPESFFKELQEQLSYEIESMAKSDNPQKRSKAEQFKKITRVYM